MLPVNTLIPASSTHRTRVYPDNSKPEDQDIWFDAIDFVEMEETWFEGDEAFAPYKEHHTDPSSSAGEAADSLIPFTEDCRRSVKQFIRILGEYGESKIFSVCLSKILPGSPASLVIAANSLYTAVTERRNIDIAALHALGLASGYLPENINIISRLAAFIRDTVTGWTEGTFPEQFSGNGENYTSAHLFTALAITAIVAGRRMKDEGAPQRDVLKVPAFMANIFIRAAHYWTALGNMAGNLPSGAELSENSGKSQQSPAFEVDTRVEIAEEICNTLTPCLPSAPRLTAFSSNSTANPESYLRGIVKNNPALPEAINSLTPPEHLHYRVVDKFRQESGLSDLLYCATAKTEICRQTNEKRITSTYFNTKCDATAYPESIPVRTGIPGTPVSTSATGRSGGDTILPLVVTGAAMVPVPVATSYMQALKSKAVITAGTTIGLLGLTAGGKALWDRFSSSESIRNDEMKSELLKATDMNIQKLSLSGTPKEVFKTYRLISDESGQSKRIQPQKAMNLDLIRLGSEMYKTKDYLTFSLPPQSTIPDVHQIGVVKKIKKGINNITFDLRSDTGHSKCTIFSVRKYNAEDILKLSKRGKDLIIWDNGNESVKRDFFMDLTQTSTVDIVVNRGLMSFIDININDENVYADMNDFNLSEFFVGIDCEKTSQFYREVHIKDLKEEHVKSPVLLTDWLGFISVAEKMG